MLAWACLFFCGPAGQLLVHVEVLLLCWLLLVMLVLPVHKECQPTADRMVHHTMIALCWLCLQLVLGCAGNLHLHVSLL